MTQTENKIKLEEMVCNLRARVRHLTNELYLTKEEQESATRNYFDIYSRMEKIIAERTEKLRKSKQKYQRIFENIQDVYFESTLDGQILEISPSIDTISHYTREELIGKSLYEIYRDPKERDKIIEKLLKDGSAADYDVTLIDKDESIHTCAIMATVISDREGSPVKIVGSMRDITERKESIKLLQESERRLRVSEGELRSIINNAPDIIFRIDPNGNIIFINETIRDYGFSAKELIGKKIIDLVHPDDREKAIFRVQEKRTGVRRTKSIELRLLTKNLTPIPFESKSRSFGSFLIDAEGIYSSEKPTADSFVGSIVVARDISDRKRQEAKLQQTQKLEAIGVLAGGIAHDFNNLLSVIMGNVELANDDIPPKIKATSFLKEIKKACLRAHKLTNKLLTFSNGGIKTKKTHAIDNLIKEAIHAAIIGADVQCESSMADDLWPIEIDYDQILCAVKNIIENAADAMPGGGTIRIEAENVSIGSTVTEPNLVLPGGNYVKLSIQDHGFGISENNLSKIFDPYFSTKELGTQKGMGMGLATAYAIINRHNGQILAASEIGIGSTFIVYLPAVAKIMADEKPSEKAKTQKNEARTGKILVMDDEKMIRSLSEEILKQFGYEAELAKDGAEAIERYQKAMDAKKPFDAVILDLTVKTGMGGKETVKKLLEINPRIKAIASSGSSQDPIMINFGKYGFVSALPKPYTIKQVGDMLIKVMMEKDE